jgi:hypothetical protein
MPTISLDQDHRAKTLAVTKISVLTCVSTSGRDVYTRGITDSHQTDLRPGESMLVPVTTLTVRIFSFQTGNARFSAELSLDSSTAARAAHLESVRQTLGLANK